jgi:hypothetical protein
MEIEYLIYEEIPRWFLGQYIPERLFITEKGKIEGVSYDPNEAKIFTQSEISKVYLSRNRKIKVITKEDAIAQYNPNDPGILSVDNPDAMEVLINQKRRKNHD